MLKQITLMLTVPNVPVVFVIGQINKAKKCEHLNIYNFFFEYPELHISLLSASNVPGHKAKNY